MNGLAEIISKLLQATDKVNIKTVQIYGIIGQMKNKINKIEKIVYTLGKNCVAWF
jgi:hypothetical protein